MTFFGKIWSVIRREIRIWVRRPVYIVGSVFVMAFCTIFYLTFLRDGVPSDVPIAVVDLDNSSTSREFCRQLDATQLGRVVRYDDFALARADMQGGRVTSVCVIPEGFNRDIQAQRQPTVSFYVNGLYFLGGSLAWKDLLTMVNLTGGAVQREVLRMRGVPESSIMNLLRPVDIDVHQIGNPTMNYGAYLANMMIPGMLQMVVVILLIYSLGTELKYGTSRHLLQSVDGDIYAAVSGKIALYTVLFTLIGWTLEVILYKWMHFPLAGRLGQMLLACFLLVLASEAVAVFIIGLVPVCRFALSIGALYSVLGLSLTGFTLPVEAMPAGLRGLALMYPLRYYYGMYVQVGVFGSGFGHWYFYVVMLLLFCFLPFLVMRRLGNAYEHLDYGRN
ncbi:MAG: ABC transporter permease [Bacteroidales bacterium]|nr:ABC transporter permease [Bacteroidales bacterium]